MLRWLAFGPACATLHGHGSKVLRRPALGLEGNTLEDQLVERSPAARPSGRNAGACRSVAVRHGPDDLRVGWIAFVDRGRTAHAAQPSGWEAERWMTTRPGRAALLGLRTAREALSGYRSQRGHRAPSSREEPRWRHQGAESKGNALERIKSQESIERRRRLPAGGGRNGLVPGSKALKSILRRRSR